MANRERGEVAIEVDGERMVLRFDFNTMCDLEDRFDCDMEGVLARLQNAHRNGRDLRAFFHHALRGGGHDLDEAQAGTIIGTLGVAAAVEALVDAIRRYLPEPVEDGDEVDPPAPRGAGAKA